MNEEEKEKKLNAFLIARYFKHKIIVSDDLFKPIKNNQEKNKNGK